MDRALIIMSYQSKSHFRGSNLIEIRWLEDLRLTRVGCGVMLRIECKEGGGISESDPVNQYR